MRFRKSIKIAPGLKINLSKSGVSTTIGAKGLSANIGDRGAYLNTGIPGTGVSARHKIAGGDGSKSGDQAVGMDQIVAEAAAMGNPSQPIPGVDKPRSKITAYLLLLFLGLVGGHKFYLKKYGMGFLYIVTMGLFSIGCIADLFTLGRQVDAFNAALEKESGDQTAPTLPESAELAP
ncbi:MAG: DUF4236 domain-containing protein [Treponema sp.]|jgi:TM2 domain-containing membrane protein YozV|nr:DUF4236 domain-containing protein [Treponema sp.]